MVWQCRQALKMILLGIAQHTVHAPLLQHRLQSVKGSCDVYRNWLGNDMQDSALRVTAAQVASPPGGSANTSTASFANTIPVATPEALAVPAAALAGSPEPSLQPSPSLAAARAAAGALAPASAPRQVCLPALLAHTDGLSDDVQAERAA